MMKFDDLMNALSIDVGCDFVLSDLDWMLDHLPAPTGDDEKDEAYLWLNTIRGHVVDYQRELRYANPELTTLVEIED